MSDYLRWLRGQVGTHLIPLAYTTAIIRDEHGRILFQRRSDFKEAWWGLPGGLLDPYETPEACVAREVLEETSLQVRATRLTGVYSSPRYNVTYPNGDQVQQITSCFECQIEGGTLRPDQKEVTALQFFSPEALPPRPVWYAEMIEHMLAGSTEPYFDPPECHDTPTAYPTLLSLRPIVGQAPMLYPGATALVVDDEGRLLLQRRADNGEWWLPAGALDVGETLAHTALRETREETGLEVCPTQLVAVHANYSVTYPNGDQLLPVVHIFRCQITGGTLRADGEETLEVRFFARDALPELRSYIRERALLAFTAL